MSEIYEYTDFSDNESAEWSGDSYESSYPESYESEWTEAARRRGAPVRTAPRKSAYKPRPSGTTNYVTQAQLEAVLARVSQQITVNSSAIKTVDGRVRSVAAEQGKQATAFRKEMTERRKDADTLRRELQTTRELSALLPLVAPPGSGTLATIAPLAHLLPSEIFSGSSSGGQSAGILGGGSGAVALLAIVAASGAFKS